MAEVSNDLWNWDLWAGRMHSKTAEIREHLRSCTRCVEKSGPYGRYFVSCSKLVMLRVQLGRYQEKYFHAVRHPRRLP